MPGGKQQDEHAQPDAQLKDPAQPVGQGQRLMKVQQQPAEGPYAYVRPVADSSHPMGFPGRFHASSAPTVAKAAMNTATTTTSNPLPLASFAGSGCMAV